MTGAADGRRRRRRGLRADRGLPAPPHPPTSRSSSGATPRRTRPHPRRADGRRRDQAGRLRLHRAQRPHLSPAQPAVRRARRRHPADRDEHGRSRATAAASRTSAGAARAASSPSAAASPTRASCACWRRCAGSSGPRSRMLADRPELDWRPTASSSTRHGFDEHFVRHYALPVVACVWSSGDAGRPRLPRGVPVRVPRQPRLPAARRRAAVARRRGRLALLRRRASRARLDDVRVGRPGHRGHPQGRPRGRGRRRHGPSTTSTGWCWRRTPTRRCSLLTDASDDEFDVLGAFGYSANTARLHRDDSRAAATGGASGPAGTSGSAAATSAADDVQVTYWMNRLQGHPETRPAGGHPQRPTSIRPSRASPPCEYTHPIFTPGGRRGPAASRRRSTPTGPRSPAPTTAGASTRTAAAPASPPPSTSGPPGEPSCRPTLHAGAGARARCATPASTRSGTRSGYRAHQWLVDADRPEVVPALDPLDRSVDRRRATTSARRTARSATTSDTSSRRRASTGPPTGS